FNRDAPTRHSRMAATVGQTKTEVSRIHQLRPTTSPVPTNQRTPRSGCGLAVLVKWSRVATAIATARVVVLTEKTSGYKRVAKSRIGLQAMSAATVAKAAMRPKKRAAN